MPKLIGSRADQVVVHGDLNPMAYQTHDSVQITGGRIGGRAVADIGAGVYAAPVQLGVYTRTTVPAASAYTNYVITVTDATGGRCVAQSDGTAWISQRTGNAV